eukprot:scaffold9427_cov100-Isochrysis_galbana.AAC.1
MPTFAHSRVIEARPFFLIYYLVVSDLLVGCDVACVHCQNVSPHYICISQTPNSSTVRLLQPSSKLKNKLEHNEGRFLPHIRLCVASRRSMASAASSAVTMAPSTDDARWDEM